MIGPNFQEISWRGTRLSEVSLSALFQCFAVGGLLEEAHAQFLEMQAAGIIPSVATYCGLITLFAKRARLGLRAFSPSSKVVMWAFWGRLVT